MEDIARSRQGEVSYEEYIDPNEYHYNGEEGGGCAKADMNCADCIYTNDCGIFISDESEVVRVYISHDDPGILLCNGMRVLPWNLDMVSEFCKGMIKSIKRHVLKTGDECNLMCDERDLNAQGVVVDDGIFEFFIKFGDYIMRPIGVFYNGDVNVEKDNHGCVWAERNEEISKNCPTVVDFANKIAIAAVKC